MGLGYITWMLWHPQSRWSPPSHFHYGLSLFVGAFVHPELNSCKEDLFWNSYNWEDMRLMWDCTWTDGVIFCSVESVQETINALCCWGGVGHSNNVLCLNDLVNRIKHSLTFFTAYFLDQVIASCINVLIRWRYVPGIGHARFRICLQMLAFIKKSEIKGIFCETLDHLIWTTWYE